MVRAENLTPLSEAGGGGDAAGGGGGAAGGGAEGDSPMMRVRTLEVMSPAECEAAVAEAEAWGAANGWTTDRHIAFPTVDVPIANLPQLHKLWKESRLLTRTRTRTLTRTPTPTPTLNLVWPARDPGVFRDDDGHRRRLSRLQPACGDDRALAKVLGQTPGSG